MSSGNAFETLDPLSPTPEETHERLSEYADLELRRRLLPSGPMDLLMFVAILFLTPLEKRYPTFTLVSSIVIISAALIKSYLVIFWKNFLPKNKVLWRKLFVASIYLSGMSFGTFCAITVGTVELGWTSFFVILVTCGICAGMVSALAPHYSILRGYLYSMLLPVFVVNLFLIGGLRGYALAAVFLSFFILFLIEGRFQNRNYWLLSQRSARLQAMVDAMPGTLSWISQDLKYLGVNKTLAQLWNKNPQEFIGQSVGFAEPDTLVSKFVSELFESNKLQHTAELQCIVDGEPRSFFFVGRKCNFKTEGVVIGLDVTEIKTGQEELNRQKTKNLYSSRLAGIGELIENVAEVVAGPAQAFQLALGNFRAQQNKDPRHLNDFLDHLEDLALQLTTTESALRHFTQHSKGLQIPLRDLVYETSVFVKERFRKAGITLSSTHLGEVDTSLLVSSDLFQSIVHLLQNSYDAVKNLERRWVKIQIEPLPDSIEIGVTDSGPGIPKSMMEKIFDPTFTTKSSQEGSGFGLSLARQVVQGAGGTLTYDTQATNTRFVIKLPKQPS